MKLDLVLLTILGVIICLVTGFLGIIIFSLGF